MILIQVLKINFLILSIMADLFSPIIGAGAILASALFGSNNSDKSLAGSYRAPKGQSVAWKDGRLAIFDPTTGTYKDFMDNFGVDKIPKSVYWSLMTNQANQYFSERMWNAQNEYNTPLAQAERLRQAGINPYLAMQNDYRKEGYGTEPVVGGISCYKSEKTSKGKRVITEVIIKVEKV